MKETSVIETPGVDDIVRLDEMRPGEAGVIVDIDMSLKRNSRLVAMGVVPGTWIVVRKFAPLGDPMEIGASVLFLASPAAGFVTGHVLDVNGGMAM